MMLFAIGLGRSKLSIAVDGHAVIEAFEQHTFDHTDGCEMPGINELGMPALR
jgi:hypothetical protein